MTPDCYMHEKSQIADSRNLGHFVTIGKDSRIGELTSLGNHSFIDTDVVFTQQLYPKRSGHVAPQKAHAGNDVNIYAKSVIKSGCFIEDHSVFEHGTV